MDHKDAGSSIAKTNLHHGVSEQVYEGVVLSKMAICAHSFFDMNVWR